MMVAAPTFAVDFSTLAKLWEALSPDPVLQEYEEDYRWLDGSELRSLLNVNRALAAIHMQHCAAIHPSRLARGLEL